jgi:hypothetical protein
MCACVHMCMVYVCMSAYVFVCMWGRALACVCCDPELLDLNTGGLVGECYNHSHARLFKLWWGCMEAG